MLNNFSVYSHVPDSPASKLGKHDAVTSRFRLRPGITFANGEKAPISDRVPTLPRPISGSGLEHVDSNQIQNLSVGTKI